MAHIGTAATGKVLQGAGTGASPTFSTATYPSIATGTGKILRADGTNWVATTATYPDSAGTLANVLTSDGTNWISSPPAASGGIAWSVITADQAAVVNKGYICNKAGLLTLTLPATAAIGDTIAVTGINTALGWKIAQNANQQIFFGTSNTTAGVTGSLASINIRDTVFIVCVVSGASTVYNVIQSVGNITVA